MNIFYLYGSVCWCILFTSFMCMHIYKHTHVDCSDRSLVIWFNFSLRTTYHTCCIKYLNQSRHVLFFPAPHAKSSHQHLINTCPTLRLFKPAGPMRSQHMERLWHGKRPWMNYTIQEFGHTATEPHSHRGTIRLDHIFGPPFFFPKKVVSKDYPKNLSGLSQSVPHFLNHPVKWILRKIW